jgi:hypothetical protein
MSVVDHDADFWCFTFKIFVEHAVGSQTGTYSPVYVVESTFGAPMVEGVTFSM